MDHASKQLTLLLSTAALVVTVACGGGTVGAPGDSKGGTTSPTVEQGPPEESITSSRMVAHTPAAGEFRLPAASAFGEPGFHEVLTATQDLPPDLGTTAGLKLVLKLRDAGRPVQTCSGNHPLSGSATVDWSDALSRPKVPLGGVFDNSLNVQYVSGARTFFLSEGGTLNKEPHPLNPR